MSRLALASLLVVSLACATTSSSIGETRFFYGNKRQLMMAAEQAIVDLGGEVVLSNQSMGTVVGRFNVEGTSVDLNVSIVGSPSPDAGNEFDVTARATVVGDYEPTDQWKEQLKWFEKEFMRVFSSTAQQTDRRDPY